MTHIVPILCLILFIGLVEFRLKKHLDKTDKKLEELSKDVDSLKEELIKQELKKIVYENNSNV